MSTEIPNGDKGDQPLETQTPGAGPSRLPSVEVVDGDDDIDEEEQDRISFLKKQADYLELEQSVNSSNELLSSLETYLSTFQNDLSAVSGQISDLQGRSSEIESQLKGRKTILPPLNALITDITLSPSLILTLRDTLPTSNPELWLSSIIELDSKIQLIEKRSNKVMAIKELIPIIEGLKIKSISVLPSFLLGLIKPLKSSSKGLSTNLPILQNSLLLKYQPFYSFLYRYANKVAKQVERGYVNAARGYYETAIRRYTRCLGIIKSRNVEKNDLIGTLSTDTTTTQALLNGNNTGVNDDKKQEDKLKFKDLDVEGEDGAVILAYMADDKDFKAPIEALFRSLALVLLDNASSEFTFIVRFFAKSITSTSSSTTATSTNPHHSVRSPLEIPIDSPNPSYIDMLSDAGKSTTPTTTTKRKGVNELNEGLKESERIWHEIFSSSLEYITQFLDSIITPSASTSLNNVVGTVSGYGSSSSSSIPSVISLLTIIKLNENLINISDLRGCLPLITYLNSFKLKIWPILRKELDNNINSLKKLADDLEGKNLISSFGLGKTIKDNHIRIISKRYGILFSSTVALSNESEEVMLFSSMTRLRNELIRILTSQSNKIKSITERHSFLSSIYEIIMHELVSGPGQLTHHKLQSELSFFRTKEEDARRRISVQ